MFFLHTSFSVILYILICIVIRKFFHFSNPFFPYTSWSISLYTLWYENFSIFQSFFFHILRALSYCILCDTKIFKIRVFWNTRYIIIVDGCRIPFFHIPRPLPYSIFCDTKIFSLSNPFFFHILRPLSFCILCDTKIFPLSKIRVFWNIVDGCRIPFFRIPRPLLYCILCDTKICPFSNSFFFVYLMLFHCDGIRKSL